MPKRTRVDADRRDQRTTEAIKPGAYKKLVEAVVAANAKMDTGRKHKSELIREAVDNDHLHKKAFSWVMILRKMDPVARNELLFNFELYCEREAFAREDLLSDRGAAPSEDGIRTTEDDGEPDLRPRHLRQPGASAATAVQAMADKAGAKTSPPKGEDPIDKVGRGKPN